MTGRLMKMGEKALTTTKAGGETAINAAERATGRDLDGDGDVGDHQMREKDLEHAIEVSFRCRPLCSALMLMLLCFDDHLSL